MRRILHDDTDAKALPERATSMAVAAKDLRISGRILA